jgi:competence protein ComEA
VNVNQANLEQLQALPGIGPRMAEAIVAARTVKPFSSVEDLRRVRGIGPRTLDRLRPHVAVGQ